MRTFLLISILVLVHPTTSAQSAAARAEAHQYSLDGADQMLARDYPKAVASFSRAHRLDPKNNIFTLQLAEAHFFNKSYKKTMALVGPMLNKKKDSPEAYQLYGNSLDMLGKSAEAVKTYKRGIRAFPNSGLLFMELGIFEYGNGDDRAALAWWEAGMRANPTFPSNYYYAAKRSMERGDFAWAGLYAEMFLNLERIGTRTHEVSELLMAAYAKARIEVADEGYQYRFDADAGGDMGFFVALNEAFKAEVKDTARTLTIAGLYPSRRFAAFYMCDKHPLNPAHGMFEWHRLLSEKGFFRAYTYWLLYDARPKEFLAWYESHKDEYEAFENWFIRNTYHKQIKTTLVRAEEEQ